MRASTLPALTVLLLALLCATRVAAQSSSENLGADSKLLCMAEMVSNIENRSVRALGALNADVVRHTNAWAGSPADACPSLMHDFP